MKQIFFLSLYLPFLLFSQNYNIGEKQITVNDPIRNRNIACQMFYPAVTAGIDASIENGKFPLIVFGHGFLMAYSSYRNFVDRLVPKGYIIVFPTTEGGLNPNHTEFANDLKFVSKEFSSLSLSQQSFFLYGKLNGRTALMGHSMGGGCSMLAAKNNNNISIVINFAAAETSESAIAASSHIQCPVFMFTGSHDGVTPPSENQIPMFQNLSSTCKAMIEIKGGGHCNFANFSLACSAGELTTSPQPTITREEQHDAVFSVLIPLLEWMLKWNLSQENIFKTLISDVAKYNSVFTCNISSVEEIKSDFTVYPVPFKDYLYISTISENDVSSIQIFDIYGKSIYNSTTQVNGVKSIDTSFLKAGVYMLTICSKTKCNYHKIIKSEE